MYDKVGLKVTHDVSISGSWRGAFRLLDGPERFVGYVHEIEDVKIVISQLTTLI